MGDQMRRWAIVTTTCAALLALVDVSVGTHGQNVRDVPIPHDVGQSVSPSFEGWSENADGTFSLSFGYMN